MPKAIGAVISSQQATLKDLQTYYGTSDLYDMLEVIHVDIYNQRVIAKARESQK